MAKHIDYYFTPISPWTYLGSRRFEAIARRHGASIAVKPVDYMRIFPVSGGLPLGQRAKQRQDYRLFELKRWREHLQMPLTLHPAYFPADADPAARLIIAARRQGLDALGLAHALLRAVWAEDRNLADPATLIAAADALQLDGKALLGAAESRAVADEYQADTDAAIQRGVFGAPTYCYRDEPFWGQDRLDFLDRALAAG
ncbi:MAG TPA: 2-hydroxychromene-2-carboxylate isomerase [Candidatus Sulfotelmatobacter sp.]|nr:2-hydroxychromene-2-carboxylate isomerase [Candidatus Sulfotelmatobacter sp.]